ncbi:MAG: sigma-70 family RNA polymerase sigma factor [Ktedonobacteraceae bacterium]
MINTPLPDCELIRQIREKNQEQEQEHFRLLIERYDGRILRIVSKKVKDEETIQDLCQEIRILAWEKLPLLRDPCKFAPWYYKIAVNVVNSWRRKNWHRFDTDPLENDTMDGHPSEEPTPEDLVISAESFQRALRKLNRREREVLRRHLIGYTHEKIAEELGLKFSTIKVYLSSGMRKLLEALRHPESEDEQNRKESE